MLILVDKNII